MFINARWGALFASLGIVAIANCSESESTPTPANDSGTGSDSPTPSRDTGTPGADGGGGSDTGTGNDTGTGLDAAKDAPADSPSGGGFAITGPESVFAVPIGYAGTTAAHVLVAASTGIELRALAGGAIRGGDLIAVTAPTGVIGYQVQRVLGDGGPDLQDVVDFYNANSHAISSWNVSDWGATQLLGGSCVGCAFSDLVPGPAEIPPTGHTILSNGGTGRVEYQFFDAGVDNYVTTSTQPTHLKISGGNHNGVTATQRTTTSHGLVIAVPTDGGTTGQMFVHDRVVANPATPVMAVGTSPKLVRCSEAVCIVTNSGSNNVTVFTWNGATTIANATNANVGTAPIGVDIKKSGAEYIAVVANSGAGSYSVIRLNASAGVVSNTATNLTGCANPKSVSFVPGTDTFAIACKADNKIVVGSL